MDGDEILTRGLKSGHLTTPLRGHVERSIAVAAVLRLCLGMPLASELRCYSFGAEVNRYRIQAIGQVNKDCLCTRAC
jgi:hypothetical protein